VVDPEVVVSRLVNAGTIFVAPDSQRDIAHVVIVIVCCHLIDAGPIDVNRDNPFLLVPRERYMSPTASSDIGRGAGSGANRVCTGGELPPTLIRHRRPV